MALPTRLISFDVGIKNLAYCIFDFDHVDKTALPKMVQWNVLNLCESTTIAEGSIPPLVVCQDLLKNKKNCGKPAKYRKNQICMCEKHAKTHGQYKIPQEKSDQSLGSLKKKSADEIKTLYQKILSSTSSHLKADMIQELVLYYQSKTWDIINVPKKSNASKIDLISIGRSLHAHLSKNEVMSTITHVIIENQISPIANRMKTLQGMLAQHFISLGVEHIHFVSSGNKLKDFEEISDANTPYQKHKKDAVIHCGALLEKMGVDDKWAAFFLMKGSKKDDLADCFLQGIWYLKKLSNKL